MRHCIEAIRTAKVAPEILQPRLFLKDLRIGEEILDALEARSFDVYILKHPDMGPRSTDFMHHERFLMSIVLAA
jgi:hypothetical protein